MAAHKTEKALDAYRSSIEELVRLVDELSVTAEPTSAWFVKRFSPVAIAAGELLVNAGDDLVTMTRDRLIESQETTRREKKWQVLFVVVGFAIALMTGIATVVQAHYAALQIYYMQHPPKPQQP